MINGLFLFLVSRTDRQVRKKSTEVIFFNYVWEGLPEIITNVYTWEM